MENDNSPATEVKEQLISSFTNITSSSREEGRIFLEANEWNVDAAVSNFNKTKVAVVSAEPNINVPNPSDQTRRNRSFKLLIKLADISGGAGSGSGTEVKSSEIVDDHMKAKDVDDDDEDSYESPRPKYRSIEDIYASTPEVKMSNVTTWKNGYTIDDGQLKKFDDREDTEALAIIIGLESPRQQYSPNGKTLYTRKIIRRQEEYFTQESPEVSQAESDSVSKPFQAESHSVAPQFQAESDSISPQFQAESDNVSTETPPVSSESMNTASPSPSMGLVIDPAAQTTRIEIRFAVGSAIVSLFNTHHTVRDIRGLIDASRPNVSRDYQLFISGTLPPQRLTDLDQTIEEAGLANSVLIHYQY